MGKLTAASGITPLELDTCSFPHAVGSCSASAMPSALPAWKSPRCSLIASPPTLPVLSVDSESSDAQLQNLSPAPRHMKGVVHGEFYTETSTALAILEEDAGSTAQVPALPGRPRLCK